MSHAAPWTTTRLEEVVAFVSGGTPSKSRTDYWGHDVPWITARDMHSARVSRTTHELTSEGARASRVMPRGTVFILTRGMMLLRRVPVVVNELPSAFNQDVKALIADEAHVHGGFLALLLEYHQPNLLNRVSIAGHGTGRLDTGELGDLAVRLPLLEEQWQIAEILGTWDVAIDRLVRRRAVAERARSGLRGSIRSDPWVRLAELLTEPRLLSAGSEQVHSVSVHRGVINQIEHLGRSFAAATTSHYNRVEPGDIVYTKSPTGDFPYGIVKKSRLQEDAIVSPLYGVFRPRDEATGTLVEAYFESPLSAMNYLEPLVQKGAKNTIAITNRRFLEGRVPMPEDSARREALAGLLEQSRTELDLIDRHIELLRLQKRGLMQKLLSGEIRVGEGGAS